MTAEPDSIRILKRFSGMLEEDGALPLYYQVKQLLLAIVESGELPQDGGFFSEEEIAQAWDVSRPTVGRAMRELISSGIIQRDRGKRACVCEAQPLPLVFMGELISFGEMLQRLKKPYRTELVSRQLVPASPEIRRALGTDEKDVVHLRRLRFVDETPMLFVNSYLPGSRFESLMELDRAAFGTDLYSILALKFGVQVRHAEREVMAVRAGIDESKLLGIPLWEPCLRLSGTSFDETNQAVEAFVSYLKGSLGVLRSKIMRHLP